MGSTRDYDDLVEALGAYDRSCRAHRLDAWERLTVAADRCGRPAGEPPMTWARGRVAVYQQQQRGGF